MLQRPAATHVLPAHRSQDSYGYVVRPGEQPMVLLQPGGRCCSSSTSRRGTGPGRHHRAAGIREGLQLVEPARGRGGSSLAHRERQDRWGAGLPPAPLALSFGGYVRHSQSAGSQPVTVKKRPHPLVEDVAVRHDVELNRSYSATEKLAILAHELDVLGLQPTTRSIRVNIQSMTLPADAHVHSEWSWDTGGPESDAAGRMQATCQRASRIGLPALIFTEHLDLDDDWHSTPDDLMPHQRPLLTETGIVNVGQFDIEGYLDCIDRCQHEFPQLRILTGIEYGQPHLNDRRAASLLDLDIFDRINGSLHTLATDVGRSEPSILFRLQPPDTVIWSYLEEIPRMVSGSDSFSVFTHIDYPVRSWPTTTDGPFDPKRFEEGFRSAMRAIADSGRALEMNTRRLWPWIPQWWAEEGGQAITFGSDAHTPEDLAAHFPEAVLMVERFGFRPGNGPEDFWTR